MLNRKMFRDIKKNLSQFITIFLMVTIGIMVYTTMLSYSGAMQRSGDKYYKENNLFDLEAFGENFTKEDLNNIKKLDNVKDAERKLTVKGINKEDTLEINFIESNNITKFYVLDGDKFDVNVCAATGCTCSRCWMIVPFIDVNELCPRCAKIVNNN